MTVNMCLEKTSDNKQTQLHATWAASRWWQGGCTVHEFATKRKPVANVSFLIWDKQSQERHGEKKNKKQTKASVHNLLFHLFMKKKNGINLLCLHITYPAAPGVKA